MELNKRRLLKVAGITFIITGLFMIPPLLLALSTGQTDMIQPFRFPMIISLVAGIPMYLIAGHPRRFIKIRDGYMTIFLIFIIAFTIGAIPYYMAIDGATVYQCFFESAAGFTTTTASVFGEPSMNHCLLLWKSIQHWLGGIITLIITISILPVLGSGDHQIATAEAHGTFINKIAPRYLHIIKYIFIIYTGISLLAYLFFVVAGTGSFDAALLAMTTTSTSGILLHPEGISYYNSTLVELGVTIFTLVSGINYVVYIHVYRRNFQELRRNTELKAFALLIALSTVLMCLILRFMGYTENIFTALNDGFFQVTSFITTSGFALEDYSVWPAPAVFLLFVILLIGGCSASTTGSMKLLRVLIVLKLIMRDFYKRIHPRAVRSVRIGSSPITTKMGSTVTSFVITFLMTILVGTTVLTLQNIDIDTAFSAAVGTVSNSGISFGTIGMNGDYSMFEGPLLIFLTFLMMIGRLGFFTVTIMFLPSFWRPAGSKRIIH